MDHLRKNWNYEMLVFRKWQKRYSQKKSISEQERKLTTNSSKVWRHFRGSNPGHIGGMRVLSPLNPLFSLFFLLPRKACYLVMSLLNCKSKLKLVDNLLCSRLQALLECVRVFFIAELSDPFNEPLFEKVFRSVKDLKSSVTAIRKTLQNKTAGGTEGKNT